MLANGLSARLRYDFIATGSINQLWERKQSKIKQKGELKIKEKGNEKKKQK